VQKCVLFERHTAAHVLWQRISSSASDSGIAVGVVSQTVNRGGAAPLARGENAMRTALIDMEARRGTTLTA